MRLSRVLEMTPECGDDGEVLRTDLLVSLRPWPARMALQMSFPADRGRFDCSLRSKGNRKWKWKCETCEGENEPPEFVFVSIA
jgi:hypothetical protein